MALPEDVTKLLAAYAKHHNITVEAAKEAVVVSGIRRLAHLDRYEARKRDREGWAGKSDTKRGAPGRKGKKGAHGNATVHYVPEKGGA